MPRKLLTMRPQRSAAARTFGAGLDARVAGEFMQQRGLRHHHRQRIVEFMRNAGKQRTHGRHLLVLMQPLALAVDLVLGPPPFAQVADRAEDQPFRPATSTCEAVSSIGNISPSAVIDVVSRRRPIIGLPRFAI